MKTPILLLALVLLFAVSASAQTTTTLSTNNEVAGAGDLTRSQGVNQFGGNFSYTRYLAGGSNLGIEGDVGFATHSPAAGVSTKLFTLAAGPKFKLRSPTSKLEPFAHALLGVAHSSFTAPKFAASTNGFALIVGGGLDYKISGPFAARAQVDYIGTRFSGVNSGGLRAGVGIAVSF
jgi:hypothetical protein